MSKNVKVNGVDYTGVSQVQLPTTAGGTALFKDVDEITTPSGTINITENGTHNVLDYAQAVVNVASGGGESADNYEDFLKMVLGYTETMDEDVHFTVPNGVKALRQYAFAHFLKDSVSGICYITLPDSVEEFKDYVFAYNFRVCIGQLPPNLKKIGKNCFQYAASVFGDNTELEIPASVETIESLAFYTYNGKVNTITFKGTPTTIANNALQNEKFTTINVPWAEGAVANAPWGATKATINYNYKGA